MLNLSKNGIELLRTHSVVGIEPVWILSQILIQSVKLSKIPTCLIYRVYPILSIVFFPSIIKKQCSCCLSPIHNDNGKYIEMLQMLLTTLLNSQDLWNLWNASVYMHIYYLLENTQQCKLPLSNYGTIIYGNGKTNSSANCLYLIIMGPLSMENKQQCNQFEQENSLYTQKIVR